jgi:hypothetical protein
MRRKFLPEIQARLQLAELHVEELPRPYRALPEGPDCHQFEVAVAVAGELADLEGSDFRPPSTYLCP